MILITVSYVLNTDDVVEVFAQGFFASTDGFEVASNEGHGVGDANKSHA